MPTYQYKCSNCSYEFEEFQSMKDSPLVTCPKCKQERLERVIGSGAGMIFKGSGFYQTDYRSKGYKESAKKEKPASSCSGDCKSCPSSK